MTLPKLAASLLITALLAIGGAVLTDRRADARERLANAQFPAIGQIITVAGQPVHVVTRGTGPDVVLIHGASGSLRDFNALIDDLATTYRVTAFDRPGLGWTPLTTPDQITPQGQARLLRAAATQLGITHPIVLGHSYGGAVAMAWGLQAPDDTRALVLVSAPTLPWPGTLDPTYRLMNTRIGRALLPPLVAAFAPDTRVKQAIAAIFAPQTAPVGYIDTIGASLTLRRDSFRANADQINDLRAALVTMSADYPSLSLPMELIHGDTDTIVPLQIHSAPLAMLLPNARLTVLPGIGHMPHHSHIAAIRAAIDRVAQTP